MEKKSNLPTIQEAVEEMRKANPGCVIYDASWSYYNDDRHWYVVAYQGGGCSIWSGPHPSKQARKIADGLNLKNYCYWKGIISCERG